MCQSSDSPDGILLDKTKKLDTNQTEGYSFFLALKQRINANSKIRERAMMGGPLKMPMWSLPGGFILLWRFLYLVRDKVTALWVLGEKPQALIENRLSFSLLTF